MRNNKKLNQSQSKNDIFSLLGDKSLFLIIELFLSLIIMGGGGYMLFQVNSDFLQIEQRLLALKKESLETGIINEVIETVVSGLLSNKQNFDNIKSIFREFRDKEELKILNPTFKKESLEWSNNAIIQLTSEKGRIRGVLIKNELFKGMQAEILKIYDFNINVLNTLKNIIVNWEHESSDERDSQFRLIKDYYLQFLDNAYSLQARCLQALSGEEIIKQEFAQEKKELLNELSLIERKVFLSKIGILVGIIMLAFFIFLKVKQKK